MSDEANPSVSAGDVGGIEPRNVSDDHFALRLPVRLHELSDAVDRARAERQELPHARHLAHRLRGTAGSYGYQDVGDLIGGVEELLSRIAEGSGRTPFLWERAEQSLRDAVRFASLGPDTERLKKRPLKIHRRPLLVIDDDEDFLRLMRAYARRHSMEVATARTIEEGLRLASAGPLCGVLLDVHLEDDVAISAVGRIRATPDNAEVPLIFASVDGSLETRVAAVAAGGDRFLDKPLSEQRFSELLMQVPFAEVRAARIVILDDDEIVLERYRSDLEDEGYYVCCVSDPRDLVQALDETRPDALLLDVNLGGMSGIDVCRALRSSERWQFLPILMFSSDRDAEMRVRAYQAGASDVLGKPLSPEELMTRVSVHAERIRLMRERSDRDALSGVMLRRAFVEALQRAFATCSREKKSLALVLIDLDHFKQVNDCHGHLSGDRVISEFGQLIQSRFRVEDLRGRWGGEEFVLAFPGATAEFGVIAAERLLAEFSQVPFDTEDGGRFHVTFTAGVAEFPNDGESLDLLLKCADALLYEGKAQGRGRVLRR